ncbi:LysR family transcriptional regulator [Paracidovorax anthurii]|uniref:DNA-binding transcriptional LysR family regulator n=1 Tax=Paracidovorax anthurii TaxID=78229 RepID=A0A328ZI95_9BURK|nr:LysR family transcriptional regulator [Paracidovorax anthurii]RAR85304.1 DNA-binding transcriptional LysR family regulator [Paracidovorax anthurii]
MSSNWTLDQLEVFLQVLEAGSFSAAADRLGVSQPAVSLQVRQLERRLGVRLIERVGKRVAPTPAGAELRHHGQGVQAAVRAASEAVRAHAAGVTGTVRLGTGATACLHFLPAVLRGLRQLHPTLQVVVSTGNTADCLQQVEHNLLDMALVTLPAARRALYVRPVLQDPFAAIAPPGAALPRTHVRPRDWQEAPLVLFEPAAHTRALIDAWFVAGGPKPRPVMELGSVEAIKEMVASGLGYSIVPAMSLRDADRLRLQVRPLRPALARSLGLVVRQDKPMARGMQALADAIVAGARERPAPPAGASGPS